jgi:hypothetical protein
MPSRDGIYSTSRKPNSYIDLTDHDIHHAQRGETTAADNSFTSAFESSSPLRPAALRRRGSDGGSSPSSWGKSMSSYHARSRTMDNDPHPLRRSSSSTTKTARHDMGSTRPRLSRALTPSTPNLSRPSPAIDKAEAHRTVLVHEVRPPYFFFPSVERAQRRRSQLPRALGLAERFSRWRSSEIRNLCHRTAPCQSALGIRFDSPPPGPVRPARQGTPRQLGNCRVIASAESRQRRRRRRRCRPPCCCCCCCCQPSLSLPFPLRPRCQPNFRPPIRSPKNTPHKSFVFPSTLRGASFSSLNAISVSRRPATSCYRLYTFQRDVDSWRDRALFLLLRPAYQRVHTRRDLITFVG